MGSGVRAGFVLVAALAGAGCVGFVLPERLEDGAAVAPDGAYVYGRFERVDPWTALFHVLLRYETPDGKGHFEIESLGGEVAAFRVPAGEYRLTHLMLATSCLGLGMQTEPDVQWHPVAASSCPPHSLPFALAAGDVCYLGDFTAEVFRDSWGPVRWLSARLTGAGDRFGETTEELRARIPAFRELPARRAWEP